MMSSHKALLIVDTQIDFCPGGSYPVPKGDEVVKPLNDALAYARKNNWKLFASRDWHPLSVFNQDMSKAHCVQNTKGAEYHPLLNIQNDVEIISKGEDLSDAHYSAFNGDDKSLADLLRSASITEVYIGGLALEYCVKATAIDSARLGFTTFVFMDATRHIKQEKADSAIEQMTTAGIKFIKTTDLQ
jgi:nicotinamidase/pyrazinamidase